MNKPTPKEELKVMVAFKKKGYQYAVQFKDFGDPVTFKSELEIHPFMKDNKLIMDWSKILDDYITELCLTIVKMGEA